MFSGERALQLTLFFVILGATLGAVETTMELDGGDWFAGSDLSHKTLDDQYTITQDEATIADSQEIGDETDEGGIFQTIRGLTNVIKRIFYIDDFIAELFYVEDPLDPANNLFAPFAHIFQGAIYLVYLRASIWIIRGV